MTRAYAGFSPDVKALAEKAGDDLKVWQLFDMEALPRWVSGHCALLGDAAHPFQPCKFVFCLFFSVCQEIDANVMDGWIDMGQGAAMAIEDAVSIATLLPRGTKPEDIPARLALYEESRRPRVDMVLDYTRQNGRDENDPLARRITGEFNANQTTLVFLSRTNRGYTSCGNGAIYEQMLPPQ